MGTGQTAQTAWRIGQSYDVHQLVSDRPLILGGVTIPHDRGLLGHSDADVVYHAVADALLGAVALGDLGNFFPDTAPEWKDVKSEVILHEVYKKVSSMGYRIANIDVTIIAEKPKLAPHIFKMRENHAKILGISVNQVSIKARTHEKIGSLGRGEGIAALSVILLEGKQQ